MSKAKVSQLTARRIEALQPGEWIRDGKASRGTGVLEARKLASGAVAYYLRITTGPGQRERVPLGIGITLKEARLQETELSGRYQRGERNLRGALDQEAGRTLGALLTAYADQLEQRGRKSAHSVRAELHNHVRDAWPRLWGASLDDITIDDLLDIVRKPSSAGTPRQAEKIRSYLRAAYAAAVQARTSPSALPALSKLRVSTNPAAALGAVDGANKARTRSLTLRELRAYWQRIQGPEHAALRFHLLTGAQRVQQLARAQLTDYDPDRATLRLLDYKGKRKEPRHHHVPLLPAAIEAMQDMETGSAGPFIFTLTSGMSGADYSGLRNRLHRVADAMIDAGELADRFTLGDLRRSVSSRLAEARISSDIRAQLQSHGLGGVQMRHYDQADYEPQIREALETWHRLLTDERAGVVQLRAQA